jgi:putative lipoprotein
VNICLGEASLLMVVTDADGLGRERVPAQKQAQGYAGKSEQGIAHTIDRSQFTIKFKDGKTYQERVTQASLGGTSPAEALKYNCAMQVEPFADQENVNLAQALSLVQQRDGNQFMYHCQSSEQSAVVSGVVSYRQRIALPPNAVVEVRLRNVSRTDTPPLAEQTINTNGAQVPFPFRLTYNPKQINPGDTYAVEARILIDGKPGWTSTNRYAVITQGAPKTAEIVVNPVK